MEYNMPKNNLLKRLESFGFPLVEVEEQEDANLTVADLVKSQDVRFWDGFPVVLANSAEKGLFDYHKTAVYLKTSSDKRHLDLLVALSLALYKSLGLRFLWADKMRASMDKKTHDNYEDYLKALKNNKDFFIDKFFMSSQRLKSVFNNYFKKTQDRLNDFLSGKEELGLEYALSQVFSPKQKELFLKKLRNEKLTKTEKEYFSRVVKKRVLALADPQLHHLSQKLLRDL